MIITSRGPDADFELADLPLPDVPPGHVRIEVEATSLNPIDHYFLRLEDDLGVNPHLPAVLHGDVSGRINAVGEGVTDFKPGDKVYGCPGGFRNTAGALAEMMVADARLIAPMPDNLGYAEAAALPLVAITVWEGFEDFAGLAPGDHVLVHGGAGGVGHVAIQFAKARGARVATTVSSQQKAKIARDFGADEIINYREESVEDYVERLTDGRGFDIVYDTVGGVSLDNSFLAARFGGKVINIFPLNEHYLGPPWARGLTVFFENMSIPQTTGNGRGRHGEILRELTQLVEAGEIHPLLDPQRFSITDPGRAHAHFQSGEHIGKIVLERGEWS